ncbi:MAG: LytTR family DNA-binding domain-containing protein [Chitinophagales bacterium]
MTALILDDEKQSRTLIRQYLQDQFPQFISEEVSTLAEAKKHIQNKTYDIIFLDINLGSGTSFDLLDELKEVNAQIIFITAHSEFAIKAFKYSAVDYLVKPIDPEEFQIAVQKAIAHAGKSTSLNIDHLQNQIRQINILNDKLVIPTPEGFLLTSISSILYCKANGNYTEIILDQNKKLISSYTLGHFNDILTAHNFIRIHRSYLINPHKITGYKRGEGGSVVMSNGEELDVSRANKEMFLQRFKS